MTTLPKKQITLILNRLKEVLDIHTDIELAEKLNLASTTIATWKQKERINLPLIVQTFGTLDLNYIIYGIKSSSSLLSLRDDLKIPIYSSRVSAGIPLTVTSDIQGYMSPIKKFHKNTFIVGVQGDSMIDAGIEDGDSLLVDTLKEPKPGNIVIARIDGELTVKTLKLSNGVMFLQPENSNYKPIKINNSTEILGVVVTSLKEFN